LCIGLELQTLSTAAPDSLLNLTARAIAVTLFAGLAIAALVGVPK
jgi:hypothetical protein